MIFSFFFSCKGKLGLNIARGWMIYSHNWCYVSGVNDEAFACKTTRIMNCVYIKTNSDNYRVGVDVLVCASFRQTVRVYYGLLES